MKSLNQIKKTTALIALLVVASFSYAVQAQSCNRLLKSKSGKVYSVNPAVITVVSTSNQAVVKVRKTGGKAETQVNIFINNVQISPDEVDIEYDNGPHIPAGWKSYSLNNVQGKTIKVQIVNQSVGKTFDYRVRIEGSSTNLTVDNKKYTGTLRGQMNKTMQTVPSCTGKTRIIVRRTGGNARATIRVWERQSNGSWRSLNNYSLTFEKNQTGNKRIFVVNSNRALKVELRNISVGNKFKYILNALAAN